MNMSQDDEEREAVTDRFPNQPQLQRLPADLSPTQLKIIDDLMDIVKKQTGIGDVILTDTDFSSLTDRTRAIMLSYHEGNIIVRPISDDEFFGHKADLVVVDEFFDEASSYNRDLFNNPDKEECLFDKPKLKQNGRSADYLKHNKVRKRQ